MKHLNVFILLFLINTIAFAQVPSEINGINYQGIAREADGTPIADDLIDIRITILDNSNANIFQETHDDVSTNQFGLFTLIIGSVNSLQSSLWSSATQIITEADFGSGYDEIGTVNLAAVPYAFKAKYEGQKIDFNTNSGYLRISNGTKDANGNHVFIDSTEISVSGGGNTLPSGGNIGQVLSTDGNGSYSWVNDNTDDNDNDPINEIQTLSIADSIITLSNGGGTIEVSSDNQNLSLTGTVISIEDGNNIDLGSIIPTGGTDDQNIDSTTLNGNILSIYIEGGNSSTVDLSNLINDADFDTTNELQTISKSGTTVTLSNGGGSFTDDDTQLTEAQVDAYANDNGYLTSFSEVDGSITNEIQDISFSGNNLSISSGSTIDLSSLQDGTGTDTQTLSISGSTLAITNGNSITLPAGTDNQDLSLSGNNLTLTNDSTPVDLSIYLDNTDSQNLTLSGNNLTISGGNSVDLSSLKDQDWYEASSTNSPNDISDNIFTMGRVGIGVNNPSAMIDIVNSTNAHIDITSTTGNAKINLQSNTGNSTVNFFESGTSQAEIGWNNTSDFLYLYENGTTSLVSKNGNIGIGTSSPSRPLDLLTNSPNSYGISHYNSTDNIRMSTYIGNSYTSSNIQGASIGTETDNPFFIYVDNNGEKFYIGNSSQSYNVGVGNNDPTQKLHITGNYASNSDSYGSNGDGMGGTYVDIQNTFGSNSSDAKVGIRFKTSNYTNGQHTKGGIIYRRTLTNGRGDLLFLNNSSDNTSDINITSDTKMIIQNDGHVGIGTSTPSTKLEVNGTITINDSADPNELNRVSTSDANLVPIAYGRINSDGTIRTGATTDNITSVSWSGSQYVISIAGTSFNINSFNAFITPIGSPIAVCASSVGGNLLVRFTGNTQSQFNFIIYKK